MASRRHKRRKAKGRFRGLYKILSIAAVIVALTVACMVFFRVQTVTVEGAGRYSAEEIIQASGVKEGDYLLTLNTERIQREIRGGLSYVERVSIRRSLPDTVIITVEETVAAAAVESQGRWWLLNSDGKLLETVQEAQAASYPKLTGVELLAPEAGSRAQVEGERESRWGCVLELLAALEERGELARLNSLECGGSGEFTALYDGRYTLLLPATIEYGYTTKEQFMHFFSLLEAARPKLEEESRDIVDFTLWESTGNIYGRRSK